MTAFEAQRPAPFSMAAANDRSTTPVAWSLFLIKPDRKYRSMVFCSSATTASSIGLNGDFAASFGKGKPYRAVTLLRTVAWVTKLSGGTSSVSQTLPPMVEPRPMTMRPKMVAPA